MYPKASARVSVEAYNAQFGTIVLFKGEKILRLESLPKLTQNVRKRDPATPPPHRSPIRRTLWWSPGVKDHYVLIALSGDYVEDSTVFPWAASS